jgi:DNA-binding PadR family transcriptional regulator
MHGKFGRGHLRGLFGHREHHERGGPWGFRRRFFEAGEVRLALLSLLGEGPRHGYDLIKELEARSGGLYKASPGSVYPNLQLLEDEGLIRAETTAEGKRVFAITDAGREELARNAEAVSRIWSRASAWDDWSDAMSPGAMEAWGPAMRVVQSAFRAAVKGDSAQIEKVRQILSRASEEIEALRGGKR